MSHTKKQPHLFSRAAFILLALILLGVAPAFAQSALQIDADIRTAEVTLDFRFQAGAFTALNAYPRETGVFVPGSSGQGSVISAPIPVTLPDPQPFLAVGTLWSANFDAFRALGGGYTVSVRGSADGEAWGDWQPYADYFFTQSGEELASDLVILDAATAQVQIRLDWEREQSIPDTLLQQVRVVFISPGATPPAALDAIQSIADDGDIVGAAVAKPSVASRTAWGCPEGQTSPDWQPEYTTVTHLIVHHTATSNVSSDWAATVRSIWNYHTNTLRWGDVGYNYLIDPNGVIYEGRAGGDNVIGAHFSCMNTNTMGVALLGDFRDVAPTTAARTALERLLAWKADQRGMNPTGTAYHIPSQLNLFTISGHRDGNISTQGCPSGTVCPGGTLHGLLPAIRSGVQSRMGTPAANLVTNGDFSAGLANWLPWDAITHNGGAGGVFQFYRNFGGFSAVVLQGTGAALPQGAAVEATFSLGNSSGVRKRVVAIVHEGDFSDMVVCSFWLPPNTPLRSYTLRGQTGTSWTNATVAFYASPADGIGWIQLDNVTLRHLSISAEFQTRCIDPGAPG